MPKKSTTPLKARVSSRLQGCLIILMCVLLSACNQPSIEDSYDNEITIAWPYKPNSEIARVYSSTLKGTAASGTLVGQGRANILNGHVTHRGLTNGIRYYYVVKYFDASGAELYVTPEISGIPGTYIAGRYRAVGDMRDVIEDTVTGLQWKRCSEGQSWILGQRKCEGEASRVTWSSAAGASDTGGWRAPTIHELSSLIYCSNLPLGQIGAVDSCNASETPFSRPTIITAAFPNTASGGLLGQSYWSSTRYASVNFTYFGVTYTDSPNKLNYLRMVRQPR